VSVQSETSVLPTPSGTTPISLPLLPPELPWLYVVIPLPAAYLLSHDLLDQPRSLLLELVKAYLPFAAYGGAFQLLYGTLVPRLLALVRGAVARAAVHLAVMVAVVLLVSFPVYFAMVRLMGHGMPYLRFVIVSFIFSFICLLPAMAVQRLRSRAMSAEQKALAERKAALEAQLLALQARTDPHFLFNSINTVASLIPEDPELAERTLERLADLFRYALESGRVRTVSLARELSMVSDYLALQSARFGSRLDAELSVEEGLSEIEVPPLLLQPLVENAIVHGTAQRAGGKVRIVVRREQEQLLVEIADDGPGPGQSLHAGSRTGVAGVIERLRLHYDARAHLSLEAQPGGGCLARMVLPISGAA
jgi:two-component system sensor histidine kinase AlgZ